jgi:transposase
MRRKRYGSDVSREQFERVWPILAQARKRTKPVTVDVYEVFCAVLYVLKSGCQWRMLPGEFPKWRTVYSYWAKWSEPSADGTSLLEQALKKSGWRGPTQTGAQRRDQFLDRG